MIGLGRRSVHFQLHAVCYPVQRLTYHLLRSLFGAQSLQTAAKVRVPDLCTVESQAHPSERSALLLLLFGRAEVRLLHVFFFYVPCAFCMPPAVLALCLALPILAL
jgi:hypothetical protein